MSGLVDLGKGDPRIIVAVLDGPVDTSHSCFAGALLEFPQGHPAFDPEDAAARHGTHVASIIFGQPGSAVDGIAPRCRGLIVPVFAGDGVEGLRCSQLQLARGIAVALDSGAHIINISGGQLSGECEPEADLKVALEACERQGVLVLAAAGNEGCDCGHIPACVATVLAVAADDGDGRPLSLSNWGEVYARNGVMAPGRDIRGAAAGGGIANKTGTSFATPVATGFAALMLAREMALGRLADPLAIRRRLAGNRIARGGSVEAIPLTTTARSMQTDKRGNSHMSTFMTEGSSQSSMLAGNVLAATPLPEVAGESVAASEFVLPVPEASSIEASCAGKDCACSTGAAQDCGCGCGGAKKAAVSAPPALVYALGQIGFDFVTEARRDSIAQFMGGKPPTDEKALLAHLSSPAGEEDVERIVWTIVLDNTPIYAIHPAGAFAASAYARILKAFAQQIKGDVTLFAIPGRIAGSIRLMSGETVPVIIPATRGMVAWDVADSVNSFLDGFAKSLKKGATAQEKKDHDAHIGEMRRKLPQFLWDFRNLVTRKYRNLGLSGRDRALNFASTAAFRVFEILNEIAGFALIIDDITVSKSAACRPGSDCYDVQLKMFKPSDVTASLRIFQFTLDVSDTIPINIGEVSSWSERPRS